MFLFSRNTTYPKNSKEFFWVFLAFKKCINSQMKIFEHSHKMLTLTLSMSGVLVGKLRKTVDTLTNGDYFQSNASPLRSAVTIFCTIWA